jgi:hypothetical protein
VKSLLEPVYRAVESGDFGGLQESMCDDVFMFTPEAGGVLASREAVVAYARRRLARSAPPGQPLRLTSGARSLERIHPDAVLGYSTRST